MKTTLKSILAAMALLISLTSYAQEFSAGVKIGMNNSNVSLSGVENSFIPDTKSTTYFNMGLVGELALSEQFGFRTELNMLKKGFEIREGIDVPVFGVDLPVGVKAEAKVKYLEMPVLAQYKFGNEKIKGYVNAGPVFGYARKGKFRTIAQVIFDIPIVSTDIDFAADNINRWETSARLGAGLSLPAGTGNIFFDAHYTHGFTQIDNISIVDLKLRNKGLGFNFGYMFPLGGRGPRA